MADISSFDHSKGSKKRVFVKKQGLDRSSESLAEKIVEGNRKALAQGITLIESRAIHHRPEASELIQKLLPHALSIIAVDKDIVNSVFFIFSIPPNFK